MSRHDDLMAAARASFVAAHSLGLPADDPQRGIDHDRDMHLDRLERAYQAERQANREMREAVIAYGQKITNNARARVAVGLIALVVIAVLLDRLADLAHRNREAVRVSCTLLTNAILEPGGTTAAAVAQRENTEIFIGAINRNLLTERERVTVQRNAAIIMKAGGVISTPACNEIARHPERVRELLLNRTTEPPRRSPAVKRDP